MSTAQRAEPGTEVQLAASVAVGTLPPDIQQALEMRKLQNQVAGKLAELNWGKALDLNTRRAIADWGQQMGVDVSTEIHVLGANVYLNAAFYMRKLGEMIAAGDVEYAYADHVEEDQRLAKLGADGDAEITRRLRARIEHNLPDKAASAVVFRVKLRSVDREIVGAKACGNGVKSNDPVGDKFPVETSESRAARRCMRLIASHVPPATRQQLEAIEGTAEMISSRISHAKQEVHAQAAAIEQRHPRQLMSAPTEAGSYEFHTQGDQVRDVPAEPAPTRTAAQRATAAQAATMENPYDAVTLATPAQKARITELLNNPELDLAAEKIEEIAGVAGKRGYTAREADAQIATLERLLPASGQLLDESEG